MCNMFRPLKASEVVLRPVDTPSSKVTLLLYQDARCAQNVLDESVGQMNWQKAYYDSNGLLFCKIGIRDTETGDWVWKADTGTESKIEGDKGLASDAFKRAAVAWGIGRELYTAPRITIDLNDKDFYNSKYCQSFSVSDMEVRDGTITKLSITDKFGNERFSFPKSNSEVGTKAVKASTPREPKSNSEVLKDFCSKKKLEFGVDTEELRRFYEYYMKPSKDNPNVSIIEAWKNPIPQKMWEKWELSRRAA